MRNKHDETGQSMIVFDGRGWKRSCLVLLICAAAFLLLLFCSRLLSSRVFWEGVLNFNRPALIKTFKGFHSESQLRLFISLFTRWRRMGDGKGTGSPPPPPPRGVGGCLSSPLQCRGVRPSGGSTIHLRSTLHLNFPKSLKVGHAWAPPPLSKMIFSLQY